MRYPSISSTVLFKELSDSRLPAVLVHTVKWICGQFKGGEGGAKCHQLLHFIEFAYQPLINMYVKSPI